MRKIWLAVLVVALSIVVIGLGIRKEPKINGSYQSEIVGNHYIQMALQSDDHTFVQYIDNREVDRGYYIELDHNKFQLISEIQTIDIILKKDNSFNICIGNLNSGTPITMLKTGDIPSYFRTEFNDIEEYKSLLYKSN